MYCTNCGTEIINEICPHCGQKNIRSYDVKNALVSIISFFFPTIGLVLWLVWKDFFPIKAKACGKMALISVIIKAILIALFVALYIWLIAETVTLGSDLISSAQASADNVMHLA